MLDMGYHMSQRDYDRFRDMPWPEPTEETVVPEDFNAEHGD